MAPSAGWIHLTATGTGLGESGIDSDHDGTGGLVVRSYQQNAARGAVYMTDRQGEHRLPQVERSIMIAVPNSGASKIWNPWNDNWVSDRTPTFLEWRELGNVGVQNAIWLYMEGDGLRAEERLGRRG